ncbi:hypothetical protein MPER_11884, partial [Moniliophthora perniciosa FA553]
MKPFQLFAVLLSAKLVYGSSNAACNALTSALPGRVFFPVKTGSEEYVDHMEHYSRSASENSTVRFSQSLSKMLEPSFAILTYTQLQVIANGDTRSPFAIKGGGHTGILGFSSTLGVQISMSRFSEIDYDKTTSTAKIGASQIWNEVYARLVSDGVKVVGGRVPGVGVSGLSLGGGYSFFTDQYGLSVDTIVSYDLVLPNGTFIKVSNETEPDLFFALKGGFNNFGIVTSFTMQTFPQTDVW